MTAKEVDKEIKGMRRLAREARQSPQKAKDLLFKTGMYTKRGALKKQFQ